MDGVDRARLHAVEEMWRTAPSLEDAIAAAEATLVRWAWFNDAWCCSLTPFAAQRNGYSPGRELPGEPDVIEWVVRCGFDERDRPVLVTSLGYQGEPESHDVRFFDGDACREFRYDSGGLVWVHAFEYEHGLLVRQATHHHDNRYSPPTQHLMEYFYDDGGRLERRRGRSWGGGYPEKAQRAAAAGAFDVFEYDDRGRLARIIVQGVLPDAEPWVAYRRRTRSSSATRLVSRLVDAVEDAVRRCAVGERAWCVALHYERESPFAPDVVIGVERERTEWGNDVDLLNPAEWRAGGPPRRLKLDDPELLELCAAVWDALSCHDDAPARAAKLLSSVARKLNDGRLPDHLDVTPGFFVYAVDLELEDLEANLRAALGKVRYRALVRSGLAS